MPRIFVTGSVCVDLIMGSHMPWAKPGTEVVLSHSETRPGGGAGNMALALAAMNADFTLIGNRGMDAFGDWLEATFAGMKVVWARSTQPTSISVGITHPDSERTFFTHLGHLTDYRFEHIEPVLAHANAGDFIMLVGAFFSPKLLLEYPKLFALAKERGLQTVLDTGWSPDGWTTAVRTEVTGWIALADHVLINQAEACGISGTNSLEQAIPVLQKIMHKDAVLICKRGADGAVITHQGLLQTVAAPQVQVIDTIGAGDTFNAGYLATLAAGGDLLEAVRFGVQSASFAISTNPRQYVVTQELSAVRLTI